MTENTDLFDREQAQDLAQQAIEAQHRAREKLKSSEGITDADIKRGISDEEMHEGLTNTFLDIARSKKFDNYMDRFRDEEEKSQNRER